MLIFENLPCDREVFTDFIARVSASLKASRFCLQDEVRGVNHRLVSKEHGARDCSQIPFGQGDAGSEEGLRNGGFRVNYSVTVEDPGVVVLTPQTSRRVRPKRRRRCLSR